MGEGLIAHLQNHTLAAALGQVLVLRLLSGGQTVVFREKRVQIATVHLHVLSERD